MPVTVLRPRDGQAPIPGTGLAVFECRNICPNQPLPRTTQTSCGALRVRQKVLVLHCPGDKHLTELAAPFSGNAEQQNKVGEVWHEEFVFGFLPSNWLMTSSSLF